MNDASNSFFPFSISPTDNNPSYHYNLPHASEHRKAYIQPAKPLNAKSASSIIKDGFKGDEITEKTTCRDKHKAQETHNGKTVRRTDKL
jgi:hypothetical protein